MQREIREVQWYKILGKNTKIYFNMQIDRYGGSSRQINKFVQYFCSTQVIFLVI